MNVIGAHVESTVDSRAVRSVFVGALRVTRTRVHPHRRALRTHDRLELVERPSYFGRRRGQVGQHSSDPGSLPQQLIARFEYTKRLILRQRSHRRRPPNRLDIMDGQHPTSIEQLFV